MQLNSGQLHQRGTRCLRIWYKYFIWNTNHLPLPRPFPSKQTIFVEVCNTSLQAWLWHQGRNLWLQFFQVQHKKYVVLCYPGKCKEKELLFWFRLTYPGKAHLSFPFSLLSTLPGKLLGTIPSSLSLAWHVELVGWGVGGEEIHHIACLVCVLISFLLFHPVKKLKFQWGWSSMGVSWGNFR